MAGHSEHVGGGILEGLAKLVERLGDLAEKSEQLGGKSGIDVHLGVGGLATSGGAPKAAAPRTPRAPVQPIREPPVDVFDEGREVVVVAEVPGIEADDLRLELRGDVLSLRAERGELRYRKEILLPRSFSERQMQTSQRNGVFEIRFTDEERR